MHRQVVALPVEQPQLRISIGDVPVSGAIALEIESVAYFAADRFWIRFATGAAEFTSTPYFAELGNQTITIDVALSGFGFTNLLVGQIDNVRIDILANTATLTGRDLSARLIDTEISEAFVNQTASQIAQLIASRHQLTANVTATTTPVGQYYELDHARSTLGINSRTTTEWNLLSYLAQLENCELSVAGTALNFGPPTFSAPVLVVPGSFIELTLDIATNLPSSTIVKSWNSRSKAVFSKSEGVGLTTTIIRPNLTQVQAEQIAAGHLATLGQHGTVLVGTMPADVTMVPGMQMSLAGTNSDFDQNYIIAKISRMLDARSGFVQTVRAYATS